MHASLFLAIPLLLAATAEAQPKYGPEAKPLNRDHAYLAASKAPDYWALAPYYVPQRDGKSCSLASVTMAVNALRAAQDLTSDDELFTQDSLLKKAALPAWEAALGTTGKGVALDTLGGFVEQSLKTAGLTGYKVEVVHAPKDPTAEDLKKLRAVLAANEKSAGDLIIANFNQGTFTGDTGGGHISPVGAYDVVKKRVLILDSDRQWYEPYWVSDEVFLKGMATVDSDGGKTRGYVWIKK